MDKQRLKRAILITTLGFSAFFGAIVLSIIFATVVVKIVDMLNQVVAVTGSLVLLFIIIAAIVYWLEGP